MLTITIAGDKTRFQIRDGRQITVFCTRNRFRFRSILLHSSQGLKIGDLRIIDNRKGAEQELVVSDRLKEAVATFLDNFSSEKNSDFDCFSFACLVFGIEFHRHHEDLGTHWEAKESVGEPIIEPAIGEAVFLTHDDDGMICLRHAAIYIGLGLYISVSGPGGDIAFSTLEDMQADWKGEFISIALPRNPQQ